MIGQLPPDFFHQFFTILDCSASQALALETQLNELCQRQWLQAQLEVLPAIEQETFSRSLEQDGISVETLNEFLEGRLDIDRRQALWQQAQLKVWGEVLSVVDEVGTEKQKQEIKELVERYK